MLSVAAACQVWLPRLDADDRDGRRKALTDAVHRTLVTGDFTGRACVTCMPTANLSIHSIRVPVMPDDELTKAIRFEATERFGVDLESAEIGFIRLGSIRQGDETRHEVILVVAQHDTASDHLDALIDAGLRPKALDTTFGACARCFNRGYRRQTDQNKVRMVLNIGHESTDVLILRGSRVGFYRGVDIGGKHLDEAVAGHLGIGFEEAVNLRRRRLAGATQTDASVDRALLEATRPLMVELAHEAALCQRYYAVTFRGSVPEFVLLSGWNAAEGQLREVIGNELRLETRVARPLDNVDISAPLLQVNRRGNMAEWATAAGLSLWGERRVSDSAELPTSTQETDRKEAA